MEQAALGDRYELGAAIGSGGFGTVYRARDRVTGGAVAVKLVLSGLGSEMAAARLRREAQMLRRVTSRHVAGVLDHGEDERGVWLVTELVEGAPLAIASVGRPLLPHEVLRVARGLLEGLAAVHAAGMLHGDVKPSNVLLEQGMLDAPRLVDFGLARVVARSEVAASIGEPMTREGTVLGSARWMAPEVLAGGEPTPRSDLYAAGLLLYDLLDLGPLFAGDVRAQLRARVTSEPSLLAVPEPLSDVLARMLARDPAARYANAGAAHEAVLDLDTAPVSVVQTDSLPPSSRSIAPPSRPPISVRPSSESRRRPSAPPPRLSSLPPDPVAALRETLRHLDLPMLEALARRERGVPLGRVARAVALSLRLELDAAALILEPLAAQSDVARAIGAALLAPRARRITRARVDSDREDTWIATVEPELAGMLAAIAATIGTREDAPRDEGRCARALARLESSGAEGTRTMLRYAHLAAKVRAGTVSPASARELAIAFGEPPGAPLPALVTALAIATIADDAEALRDLERAARVAAETGTPLFDACAATALGSRLFTSSPAEGLRVLERASTLLAHGDAPTLEHDAEHRQALALVAMGRWEEAIAHLRGAREAAHAERAAELELPSAALEALAELATGDTRAAYESVAVLGDARLAAARPASAVLAWVARALASLSGGDREAAEDALTSAETRLRETNDAALHVVVEVVGMLLDARRGALKDAETPALRLERYAQERGFDAFFWFDLLAAIVGRLPEPSAMADALRLVRGYLGPESRLARERRTDIPPGHPQVGE